MTQQEFDRLDIGDIVRHLAAGERPVIVTANYGGRVTAARTEDITNPAEWELLRKVTEIRERKP